MTLSRFLSGSFSKTSSVVISFLLIAGALDGTQFLSLVPSAQAALTLQVTSPAAGSTVSGNITFTVAASDPSQIAKLEYHVLGHSVNQGQSVTSAPYSLTWNTNWYWDGRVDVVAVAEDASGNEIVRSAPIHIVIKNTSSVVRITGPTNGQVVKGVINWSTQSFDPKIVQAINYIVDGRNVATDYNVSNTTSYNDKVKFDTSKLPNGIHDFFVWELHPADPNHKNANNPSAMDDVKLDVENGHLPLEVRGKWFDVYLARGEQANLSPQLIYADGASAALTSGVTYVSDNTSVATVDGNGNVTAVAQGATFITITSGSLSGNTRIVVRPRDFPHFSAKGKIVYSYDPTISLWIRTLFNAQPGPNSNYGYNINPAVFHASGVNALNAGFYQNPADLGYSLSTPQLSQWEAQWTAHFWNDMENWLKTNKFAYVATGDDLWRSSNETNMTLGWGGDAAKYAMRRVLGDGVVTSIEGFDETGGVPVPSKNRRAMNVINSASHPPLTWQVQALQGPDADAAWMGDPTMSNYATWYWTYAHGGIRAEYPWAFSNYTNLLNMNLIMRNRLGYIQINQPQLMLTQCTGPFYTKMVAGSSYQPGQDLLQEPGATPEQVSAEIMYAEAMGMAGVRVYAFDGGIWSHERPNSPIGSQDRQTGCSPDVAGQDDWAAVSAAFNLIQKLEPYILQPQMNAINLGSRIVTGAKQGPNGRLFTAVSWDEIPHAIHADLTPYRYPGARSVIRHHVLGARSWSEAVPNDKTADLTLQPGESVVWLFTP